MAGYLVADSVSLERTKEVACQNNLALYPDKENPFLIQTGKLPEHISLLTDNLTDERLVSFLSAGFEKIIDAQALDETITRFLLQADKTHLSNHFACLLTCPAIYQCDVSQAFVKALSLRIRLSEEIKENIHLALHETIVNGLIHGNLNIGSEYRQSARLFTEYGRILAERLNNPEYARKSMSVSASWNANKLVIRIKDEGAGYSLQTVPVPTKSNGRLKCKTGRGLFFIAGIADSCSIDDFGREIRLTFYLKDEHHQNDTYTSPIEEQSHSYQPSLAESRILIIEDNLSNQTMIHHLLNVIGITLVEGATDGLEGLQKVHDFKPDLIILDLTMPKMNGYEVLEHLKASPETQDIPVLIATASDTKDARDNTFKIGATDFITKPINPLEFFSRVKVHLENCLLIRHLERQLKQVNEELVSAQKMQQALLPTKDNLADISKQYNIDFSYYFEPSSVLGGDFWQVIPLTDKKLAVYICDFSGHGVSAALNTFRLHALMTQMTKANIELPAYALTLMNTQLVDLLPRGQFATFFLAVIDLAKNHLTYASAGVPKPFLISNGQVFMLNADGLPLGIKKEAEYTNYQVAFTKDSQLMLYSDALTESPSKEGKRLEETGLACLVEEEVKKGVVNSQDFVSRIIQRFFDFSLTPPPDDITLVFLDRKK